MSLSVSAYEAFQNLAESSPDSIIRYDQEGRIVYLNQKLAEDLNTEVASVLGRFSDEVWPDGRFARIEQAVEQALSQGISSIVEFWASINTPTSRYHQIRITPERDRNGTIVGALAFGRDVTEIKQHSQFLNTLLDTVPDFIWLKDCSGVYLSCNARFEALVGRKQHEIVGKTDYELVSQEAAEKIRTQDQLAIPKGTTITFEEWVSDARGQQVLFETSKPPMHDEHGHLIGVLGVARDITARIQSEQVLSQQQQTLRMLASVFDAAREGITITDPAGFILDVNPAFTRITGYAREEVLGKRPSILSSGQHNQAFYQTMWAILLSDGAWSGEVVNRRKTGEVYTERLDIVGVRDQTGKIKHYVGIFSDISQLKLHE